MAVVIHSLLSQCWGNLTDVPIQCQYVYSVHVIDNIALSVYKNTLYKATIACYNPLSQSPPHL